MIRRIVAVWVSLAMLAGFVVVVDVVTDITPPVKAATITVDDSGGADYFTIQEGIDAANPGDTVFVYSGTYYENIGIDKSINLTGEDRDTTIINGSESTVIFINSDWVYITGFTITNYDPFPLSSGIQVNSDFNTIVNNKIYSKLYYGINLLISSWNKITDNNISNCENGIRFALSHNNSISHNNISSYGSFNILISGSGGNTFTNNVMKKNGIVIGGGELQYWITNDIDTSNTVNSKPVYFWKNINGGAVPQGAGQVILANCTDVTIENQFLTNCSRGIQLGYSSGNSMYNNNLSSNSWQGIFLYHSNKNTIIGNNISSNSNGIHFIGSDNNTMKNNNFSNNEYGLYIDDSHSNTILNNTFTHNIDWGIYLLHSRDNDVIVNNVSNSERGIQLAVSSNDNNIINNSVSHCYESGIFIDNSHSNDIMNNDVFPLNDWGIFLGYAFWNNISGNNISHSNVAMYLHGAENNLITNNNFSFNVGSSIWLWDSLNNSIYHNNLFQYMATQANDPSDNGNKWDNGYPSGGNYWSDYGGVDNYKGPSQDIPGHDGIGDTPYLTGVNNQDNYPLMGPYLYKPLDNYIMLTQGWNLISIPFVQGNQDLIKVLEMIDGYYDAVQWHNPTDLSDPWKHYRPGKPFGNDLFYLNESMGFWLHITQPGDTIFLYNGTQPTSNQSITLHPGWNMVGYPSFANRTRDNALNNLNYGSDVDAIWTFDAATQTWEEIGSSDYFELGKGYWIHSKVTKIWDVPL